jgi:hypothetical protein
MTFWFGADLTNTREQPMGNPWGILVGDLEIPFLHELGPGPRSPGRQTATFTGTREVWINERL